MTRRAKPPCYDCDAMAFMLDTSAINRILDRKVENEWPLRGPIFVTDIQLQEILDTADPKRREFLFRGLISLAPTVIRPTDFLFQSWNDPDQAFDTGVRLPRPTFEEVQYLPGTALSRGRLVPIIARSLPSNRRKPQNPLRDGFIAEAAMLNGLIIVTADRNLAEQATFLGGRVELID